MTARNHDDATGWGPGKAGSALLIALLLPSACATAAAAPEFQQIAAGLARKQAFIAFLAPMIDAQNAWILDNRALLETARIQLHQGAELDAETLARIAVLTDYYGLNLPPPEPTGSTTTAPSPIPVDLLLIDRLLFRGDVIPPSLAIAQAANESGWGTSRFARDGNSFFGEWCLTPGCGMVPGQRSARATFEVESFATVEDAVRSYFRTLNRAVAFRRLRELRAEARMQGSPLRGEDLADGLHSYSAIGQDYIDGLRAIISGNQLSAYDRALPAAPALDAAALDAAALDAAASDAAALNAAATEAIPSGPGAVRAQ